jgi:hypothetical protein
MGSDGISQDCFAAMFAQRDDQISQQPTINEMVDECRVLAQDSYAYVGIVFGVAGQNRRERTRRVNR